MLLTVTSIATASKNTGQEAKPLQTFHTKELPLFNNVNSFKVFKSYT
jgi:hypothetical protein